MEPSSETCIRCGVEIAPRFLNRPEFTACPRCGTLFRVEVFPAFFRPERRGEDGEPILSGEETGCFSHADKRAVRTCDACGRFLCALCDCEFGDPHLCPACIESGRKKGRIRSLEDGRVLYDSIALALALYPVVILPLILYSCITAPIALWIAIRHWKTPTSILRRTKARHVIAIAASALQLAGWALLVGYYVL
ncbi:MAG: hypothetical protein ACUVYA_16315 [Planctomycetota bacterium]